MRLAFWKGLLCAMLVAGPVHAGKGVGDYRGLPTDLAAAATAFDIAQSSSDRAGLDRWLADDYVLADANGHTQSKADLVRDMTAPGHKTFSVSLTMKVRKYWKDGAALGGIVDARGLDHGKPTTTHARFLDIWVKGGNRWQVIYTQIDQAR